jgi:hypothetical protein
MRGRITSEGWPNDNPYILHFRAPVNRDKVLDRKIRHKFLGAVQILVEESLFYFTERWMPEVLVDKDWKVPEDCELNLWWGVIASRKIPASAVSFPQNFDVRKPFTRLAQLRHAAVHRLETPIDILKRMLQDAITVVGGLRDELRVNKLRSMNDALHNNDMILLQTCINKDLADFPTLNAGQATPIFDNQHITMGDWNQSALKGQPAMALAPRLRNENERPRNPRRRSASPVGASTQKYRQRDQDIRHPSMGSANSQRMTLNFVDLTEDSDEERPPTYKAPRIRHSAPAEFIDLTMED